MSSTGFKVRQGVPTPHPDTVIIAGIKTYVYGLANVDNSRPVILAILLHGRTLDYTYTEVLAHEVTHALNNVVCATFDMPNHGARLVDERANQDWKVGNPTHAQDMASIIELAAAEAGIIARYLPSYFPQLERAAATGDLIRIATGMSLGGHTSWQIAAGPDGPFGSNLFAGIVPIIGSPAVGDLLQDRVALVDNNSIPLSTIENLEKVKTKLTQLYKYPNFKILALNGGKDTLVPHKYTARWAETKHPNHKVLVDPNAVHETSEFMVVNVINWLKELQKSTDHSTTIDDFSNNGVPDANELSTDRPLDEDN